MAVKTPDVSTQKIRFVKNRPWLNHASTSKPAPVINTVPDWYDNAVKQAATVSGESPELSFYDIMAAGYTYRTPCDIEFYLDNEGNIQARVQDPNYQNLVQDRMPLDRFPPPQGFHAKHFAWWADWAVELPEGYSALYTQPMNRFELPFWTMGGIVDNDKVHLPGTMPFFWSLGVTGVLPAGTPYAQIFPFKREHWVSDINQASTNPQPGSPTPQVVQVNRDYK